MQEILQSISSQQQEERLETCLQYLKNDRGDPELLQAIRIFMAQNTKDDEVPQGSSPLLPTETSSSSSPSSSSLDDNMFLTHGVSHGLDILCTTQTHPGDIVLVERPTYFLGAVIFQSHGLKVQSLPMKKADNGILTVDVDVLHEGLWSGTIHIPRMIYIVPTHQNPTGHTMPLEDRWKLCRLARQYNILVLADEVYHLLDWRQNERVGNVVKKRPARFSVLDQLVAETIPVRTPTTQDDINQTERLGGSVSVSSFTKIFAPGVRCGWIEGSTEIIQSLVNLGYIQSQGGCAPFVGELLRTALTGGWQERILKKLNASYQARCDMLCDILQTEPGIQVRIRPTGGFFVWVDFLDLPKDESSQLDPASAFATYCLSRGLKFMPGVRCDPLVDDCDQSRQSKDLCYNSARLCFADQNVEDVENGAKLLIDCYRDYTSQSTQ
ncbi:MAG: hypothetical protein SGILL_005947 [Bacillariaceae sp.]